MVPLPDLRGRKAVVFGIAKSGLAAGRALASLGARVVATDRRERGQLEPFAGDLERSGAELVLGGHPESLVDGAALVVLSPGVPNTLPVLKRAEALGVPRISELELAWRLSGGPWAAVTGTNGKTTTTTLLSELFRAAGRPHLLGGNIGEALADRTAGAGDTAVVAEVSSFQLDDMPTFKPRVAVVCNITPDHLDRYGTMEAYVASKARVTHNQDAGDTLVLNDADPHTPALARATRARVLLFSRTREVPEGAFVRGGDVVVRLAGAETAALPAAEIGIRGPHNLENAMAALLAGLAMGLPMEPCVAVLRSFRGVEHRLEDSGEVRGVRFVNDSKGTNVDSVEKALQSFKEPVHLILGGRDKHGDFTVLAPLIKAGVARILLVGEASDVIEAQVKGLAPIVRVRDMDDAVRTGFSGAKPGEWVVLSPGCASFDMFKSYEHRGRVFKECVARLRAEQA